MHVGEVAGREYLFVTRDKMEFDIAAGKFIESGEYKGHLYGTSGESVKSIIHSGAVCVLSPHYQAIKSLRTPQLKPYIIHIQPPSFEKLKATREGNRARSTFDDTNSRGFTVNIFSIHLFIENLIKSNFFYCFLNRTKNLMKCCNQQNELISCMDTFLMRKL